MTRQASTAARGLLAAAVIVLLMVGAGAGSFLVGIQAKDQAERNQEHIDCIIGISAYASGRIDALPAKCEPVRERMTRAGVLPERIAPPTVAP